MAVPEESMEKKNTRDNMANKPNKKILLIQQEIKLARALAGNSKQVRDKALKGLKKWFKNPVPFAEDDFMRIWQGLFYTLWMSDKPLVQEECAENISQLVHFGEIDSAFLFFKCGLDTLVSKWTGIDQLRLDKFQMFVRRFLRQMFVFLKNHNWAGKLIDRFNEVLSQTVLDKSKTFPIGLMMHITEVFLEELAKVCDGASSDQLIVNFLEPFIKHLSVSNDIREINHITKHIFRHLFRQSDMGIEYHEKFRAWKKLGFPGKSVHDIVKQEGESEDERMDNDEENLSENNHVQKAMDARAGRVDVVLPQLGFDATEIAKKLEENKFAKGSNTKSRRAVSKLIEEFKLMARGIYPLGMKNPEDKEMENTNESQKNQKQKRPHSAVELSGEKADVSKKKKKKPSIDNDVITCGTFERNSGTWVVFESTSLPKLTDNSEKCAWSVNQTKDLKLGKLGNKRECPWTEEELNNKSGKKKNDERSPPPSKKAKQEQPSKTSTQDLQKIVDTHKQQSPKKTSSPSPKKFESSKGLVAPKEVELRNEDGTPKKEKIIKISEAPKKVEASDKDLSPRRITPIKVGASNKKKSPKQGENGTPDRVIRSKKFSPGDDQKYNTQIISPNNGGTIKASSHSALSIENFFSPKNKSGFKTPELLVKKSRTPPSSTKKVNINLKLNTSQDISEHLSQLKSSPGIPWDANKKPSKPLLKPYVQSPINPFYKRKIKLDL